MINAGILYYGSPSKENVISVIEDGVKPIIGKCEMSDEEIKQAVENHNMVVNALNQGAKIEIKGNFELDKK